jgi:hypothetical protein
MNRCRSLTPVLIIAAMIGGILVMAAGCNKKEDPVVRSYKISGTIYYDCAKKPYAGQMLELVHYTSTSANSFSSKIQTVTDQFGHFSFIYTNDKGGDYFSNEYQVFTKNYNGARKLLISRIPGSGSLDVGNLYVENKVKLFVDIKVGMNKGGISDTLFFGISESDYHYITPIINTADLYEFNAPARLYNDNMQFSANSFFFAIGREAYLDNFTALTDNNTVQASHLVYESKYFSLQDCAQQHIVDTVRVEL